MFQKTFLNFKALCVYFSLFIIILFVCVSKQNPEFSLGKETLNFYLTVSEKHLYDDETGIITNYEQRGDESERPVHIKVTNPNGSVILEQDAGIKVVGQTSRAMPLKSFKLTARRSYDPEHGKFNFDFFKDDYTFDGKATAITKYNAVVLRSISYGHDTTGSITLAGYSLARQAGLAGTPHTVPANVYLNDEYYGLSILTQSQTPSTLSEMFHIENKDSIVVAQKGAAQKLESELHPDEVADYYSFNDEIRSADVISDELIEVISENLDIEQFLTYVAVETLLGNADWPHNNFKIWKCDGNGSLYQDGKWRYLIYDLDYIGCSEDLLRGNLDTLFFGTSRSHLLPQLMQHPDIQQQMASIYRNLLKTVFTEKNIRKTFSNAEEIIAEDLKVFLSSDRYDDYLLNSPDLIDFWNHGGREEVLEETIQCICNNRQIISAYFMEHFGIQLL